MSELSPSLEEFRKLAVERRVIPVYRRLLADAVVRDLLLAEP